jgi:hypothetical protein
MMAAGSARGDLSDCRGGKALFPGEELSEAAAHALLLAELLFLTNRELAASRPPQSKHVFRVIECVCL